MLYLSGLIYCKLILNFLILLSINYLKQNSYFMGAKILNFSEAIKFMDERAAYYEEIGEPSDFEVHVKIEDDKLWIRQLCPDLFDVLIESEQPSLYTETTNTFNFEELQKMIEDSNIREFVCGPVFNRNSLKICYDK